MSQPWPYPSAVPPRPRSGLGVGSLAFGVMALLSAMVPFVGVGWGIVAVWTGFVARRQFKQGYRVSNGAAIAGIVLGTLVAGVGIMGIIAFSTYFFR